MNKIILFDTSAFFCLSKILSKKSEAEQNLNQFAITSQTFAEILNRKEEKEKAYNIQIGPYKDKILKKLQSYKFKEMLDWLDIIKYEVAKVKEFNIKYLEGFPFKTYSYIENFDIIKKASMKEEVYSYNRTKQSLFDDIPKKEKSFDIDMPEIYQLEDNINQEFLNALNIARKFIPWIPNLNDCSITKEETPALYLLRRFYVFYKLLREKGNKIINKNSKFNREIIHIDESMFPDMLITVPCLPYVDEIISMDINQSLLLWHLFPEYEFKLSYVPHT